MSKEIKLNVAERNMLRSVFIVLSAADDINTSDIVEIGAVTTALELEEANTFVEELENNIQYKKMIAQRNVRNVALEIERLLSSNDFVPQEMYDNYDKYQAEADRLPSALSYAELNKAEKTTFELDGSTIDWLLSKLKEYVWNQTVHRDASGTVTVIKRILKPDEAVVANSLVKAVKAAGV